MECISEPQDERRTPMKIHSILCIMDIGPNVLRLIPFLKLQVEIKENGGKE